jgi:hypothetical protein
MRRSIAVAPRRSRSAPRSNHLLVRREFSDIWVMTLSGMGGVLNDTISIYFVDAALVTAFVARSCVAGP